MNIADVICSARTGSGRSRRCHEALGLERRFLRLIGQGAWPRYGVANAHSEGGAGFAGRDDRRAARNLGRGGVARSGRPTSLPGDFRIYGQSVS